MTTDDARALVLRCLADTAPDADVGALRDDDDLHATLDLDSMDLFNLVAAIADESGVDIPDREVPRLTTVRRFVEHLAGAPAREQRVAARQQAPHHPPKGGQDHPS